MKEIRRILKEETAIPENIDKAMEDVLSGILNSPDEKTTGALSKKTNGERTKNSGNKKKIIRILLPVAAILGVVLVYLQQISDDCIKNLNNRGSLNRRQLKWLSQNLSQLQKMWKILLLIQ